ncbi:TPA: hypothetical protein ACHIRZ_004469 [Bacillus paranthracis]
MINKNKIAGENIKNFIESRELNDSWVMERANIDRIAYYEMLGGRGEMDINIAKINKFFKINDPTFFYNEKRNYNRKINHLDRKGNFFKSVGLLHTDHKSQKLKEGLEVFLEFVELLDILKATTDQSNEEAQVYSG